MEKLFTFLKENRVFSRIGRLVLVVFVGLGLLITVTRVTSVNAADPKTSPTPKPGKPSPTPKPKPSPTPKPGKCTVCEHHTDKDQTKEIDCKDVDKFLADHPGSHAGACQVTSTTNK